MHYLLIYNSVDDYITRRTPFREEHLALAKEAENKGELILAGALGEKGSAFLFLSDTPKVALDFAKKDPYVINGLITNYKVLPWTTVVGKDAQSKI